MEAAQEQMECDDDLLSSDSNPAPPAPVSTPAPAKKKEQLTSKLVWLVL